jgi:hypothetical protein
LVSEQALGKTGQSPVFPPNSRKLFQKLKFWNSLILYQNKFFHKRQIKCIVFYSRSAVKDGGAPHFSGFLFMTFQIPHNEAAGKLWFVVLLHYT